MIELIGQIITVLIAVLITYAGTRKYYSASKEIIKETGEALLTISDALDDDTLTKEEIANIRDEWMDVIATVRNLAKV